MIRTPLSLTTTKVSERSSLYFSNKFVRTATLLDDLSSSKRSKIIPQCFFFYELPYLQNLYHWLSESVFPEPPFEVPADQLCLGWYHILKSHHGFRF